MTRALLLAYIFFVSWTGVFALNPWLRFHYLVALVALVSAIIAITIRGKLLISPYKLEDYMIAVFLFIFILAALANPNSSSIGYVFVYLYVLIGLYLLMKGAFFNLLNSHHIYISNLMGVSVVGIFLSINFILSTTDIIDLQAALPRLRETTASYAGTFIRGYGFSTEPGIVAYYLNTLGPLALWYLWQGTSLIKLIKIALTTLILFGWIVTFSAGGVFILFTSIIVSTALLQLKKSNIRLKISYLYRGGIVFFVLTLCAIYIMKSGMHYYFQPMVMKLTLSEDLSTVTDRIERFEAGYSSIFSKPILGHGPGYFTSIGEGSTLNWYLMLIAESGILSIIPIVIFFGLVLIRIIKFQHQSRFVVLVGFIAGCGHLFLMATSGYLHPFLWLLIAIFYAQLARHHENISLVRSSRATIIHPA